MRKLLLAVTLLETPRASVLILDQPFDGLDVLLVANRLEQVFPEIFSHTVLLKQGGGKEIQDLELVAWPADKEDNERNKAMMKHLEEFYDAEHKKRATMTDTKLASLVKQLFDCRDDTEFDDERIPAVQLSDVSISYDHKRVLLEHVDFARQRNEHWALLGPNGSGKSSLVRVLMQTPGHGLTEGEVLVVGQYVRAHDTHVSSSKDISNDCKVEAISTDQHILLLHKSLQQGNSGDDGANEEEQTAFKLIMDNAASSETAELAMCLLALPGSVKTRSLSQLSQGEQKLTLIARALAARPKLLVLDEITHGLDPFNRAHVLRVIEAIGQLAAQQTHLVLITHHEEEITPCFSGIFEIQDKQLVERPRQQQTQEESA
ncbi:hypothetical protein JM16_006005 [Phytophthora kernoviae]|uniref:ABC transporter domain-containing protein n=1 Tax=Phytophthora kernoviae TaxID=325452 RepID=A0A8T0LWT7_9STRA|nr:hypothetical protein JM16_006005 [Phytophthora kernoviae]